MYWVKHLINEFPNLSHTVVCTSSMTVCYWNVLLGHGHMNWQQITKRCFLFLQGSVLTHNDVLKSFVAAMCVANFWLMLCRNYPNRLRFAEIMYMSES